MSPRPLAALAALRAADRSRRVTALELRLMYLLFYGAVAVYVLFFAPYLKGLGFSGEQISRSW